jgi:hypothetical protein
MTVTNLHAELYGGKLDARASLDTITRDFKFNLASNFEVKKLSPLTGKTREFLDQFTWEKPPQLEAAGSLALPAFTNTHPDWHTEVQPTLRLQGQFKIAYGTFRGVRASSAQSHFIYSNMVWHLPDLIAVRPEGWIQAEHLADERTKDFSWRVHSTIDPASVRPLLQPKQQQALDFFALTQPPVIDAEIQGRFTDQERTTLKARVALTNFTFRGESVDHFHTALEYTNQFMTFTEAWLQRGTQQMSVAGLAIDFPAQKIFLTNGFSTTDPYAFARTVNTNVVRALEPYHFAQPPTIRVHGIVPLRHEEDADLWFELQGGRFNWWKVNVPRISGSIHWAGLHLSLNDVRADFYGGTGAGQAEISFNPGRGPDFQFDLAFTDSRLEQLMPDLLAGGGADAFSMKNSAEGASAGNANPALRAAPDSAKVNSQPNPEGALSGSLSITHANSTDWRTVQGHGNLELRDGLIWSIPLFGVFSPVLDGISPGLGSSRVSAGTATFTITNGVIRSDDLQVRSPAVRLGYRGTIDLQGQVNARVEAELLRDLWGIGPLVSTVFWPVTKLFEYKVTGTVHQPKSDPVFFIPRIVLFPFHPFRTIKDLLPEGSSSTNTNSPPVYEKIP